MTTKQFALATLGGLCLSIKALEWNAKRLARRRKQERARRVDGHGAIAAEYAVIASGAPPVPPRTTERAPAVPAPSPPSSRIARVTRGVGAVFRPVARILDSLADDAGSDREDDDG